MHKKITNIIVISLIITAILIWAYIWLVKP